MLAYVAQDCHHLLLMCYFEKTDSKYDVFIFLRVF